MLKSLTQEEVCSIINLYFIGMSQRELKSSFCVSEKAIYNILYRKTYQNATLKYIMSNFDNLEKYTLALEERKQQGRKKCL